MQGTPVLTRASENVPSEHPHHYGNADRPTFAYQHQRLPFFSHAGGRAYKRQEKST